VAVCWNIGKFVNSWAVFNLQEEAMNVHLIDFLIWVVEQRKEKKDAVS